MFALVFDVLSVKLFYHMSFCFVSCYWKKTSVLWCCWLGDRRGIRPV